MSTHPHPHPRTLTSLLVLMVVLATLALTLTTTPALATACPNDVFRTGYSATLPECRAYELVSPTGIQPHFETAGIPGQNAVAGQQVIGAEQGVTAASDAASSGIAYFSTFAPAGSVTDGPFYVSTRGPAGWSTQDAVPPQSTEVTNACLPYFAAWSSDLQRGLLADGYNTFHQITCGADEPELVTGEPRGVQNLFVRDNVSGAYQIVDGSPLAGTADNAFFQAASSDLGVVVFDERAQLAPEAPEGDDFYVWSNGSPDRLLTILPNGSPAPGQIADAAIQPFKNSGETETSPTLSHALAPDGSRVVFTANGDLYVRQNPDKPQSAFNAEGNCSEPAKACTFQIDGSQTVEPGGSGTFSGTSGASADVVYFTDTLRLTSDSTAEPNEPDLYEYDFRRSSGARLIDLSVDANLGEHADVLGLVGSNETGAAGEYAYFVARGILAQNTVGGLAATAGAPNLYIAHGGTVSFVATLSQEDSCDWENRCLTARLSSTGRYLGFDSVEELTGVDNRNLATGEPDQNIFLYEASSSELQCASCGPTGQPPVGPSSIRVPEGLFALPTVPTYVQRNVSDNGQVFFDTVTPLLTGARNGQSNVYEYSARRLHLLSSGTSGAPAFFYDASTEGSDVYLITAQALAPGASGAELSVFDAKVGGGFPPAPEAPAPCGGETCSGPQSGAPSSPSISSESLSGGGNLVPVVPGSSVRSLTDAQKLAKALKACRGKRNKHRRAVCESTARRKYGPKTKTKPAKANRRGK